MKSKLPLGKKKKVEDEEYEENEEVESSSSHQEDATDATDISDMDIDESEDEAPENKSLIHKLKSKIQSLQKGKKSSGDDDVEDGEDAEVDDEVAKKKKRSKILQGVIVGGVLIFLASDYIFPPEDETPAVQLKPRPKPNKPVAQNDAGTETPAEETPTETPAETPVETPDENPVDSAAVDTPSDSPVDVTSTETPVDTPEETPIEGPDELPVDTTAETPTETPTETPEDTTTDSESVDTSSDMGLGEPGESGESDPSAVSSTDSVDGNQDFTGAEDNLTDQILEDLEKQAKTTEPVQTRKQYVAPPDYEYRGRGLVYNCTGKHWACVDAPSYKTCEDNSSSVKYLNKPTECYPFNVYETAKGCESMQNRMVSSSAKTNFCSE